MATGDTDDSDAYNYYQGFAASASHEPFVSERENTQPRASSQWEDTLNKQVNTQTRSSCQREHAYSEQVNTPPLTANQEVYVFNGSLKEAKRHYVYFWKQDDVFSQWHKSVFRVEGQEYCCAEQYMMYMKAVLLHDDKLAKEIKQCTKPWRIKSLGRKTEQFSEDLWIHNCLHVVKRGNIAKFSQNAKLKECLYFTYPRVLVEASPYDKVWGIGCDKTDPCAWNEATWEGKNLLGYILTEVRDELMCNDKIISESDKKVYFEKLMDDLKKNAFGRRRGHDRTLRNNSREEDHRSFIDQIPSPEMNFEARTYDHTRMDSNRSLENFDSKTAEKAVPDEISPAIDISENEHETHKGFGMNEIGIGNDENINFDKMSDRQKPTDTDKNERQMAIDRRALHFDETFLEVMGPQDRLFKPEYRTSIEKMDENI